MNYDFFLISRFGHFPKLVQVSKGLVLHDSHSFCIYASFYLQHVSGLYILNVVGVFVISEIPEFPNLVSMAMILVSNYRSILASASAFHVNDVGVVQVADAEVLLFHSHVPLLFQASIILAGN